MFSALLGKKRLTEEKLCNVLVNHTFEAFDAIYPEVRDYISDCPYFENGPDFAERGDDHFLLAVITCNVSRLSKGFDAGQDKRIAMKIINSFAMSLDIDSNDLAKEIQACKSLMKRLNLPSKNIVYALPRAIFHYYHLNDFQEPYFRGMKVPNPLFLKEMNNIVEPLVWDLDYLRAEFKLVS
jgi:hypothetical protein